MENGQSDNLNALIDILLVCLVFHPHFDADSVSEVFKQVNDLVGGGFKQFVDGAIGRSAHLNEWEICIMTDCVPVL